MPDAETTLSGSAFQILVGGTGKARLPIVACLKDNATLLLVLDRSVRRPNTWTRQVVASGTALQHHGTFLWLHSPSALLFPSTSTLQQLRLFYALSQDPQDFLH